MKKTIIFLLIFIFIISISTFILARCGVINKSDEDTLYDTFESIKENSGYITDITINVYTNDKVDTFYYTQYYKAPDKYKLISLSPADSQGKIIYYIGEKAFIYTPEYTKGFEISTGIDVVNEKVFLGQFAGNYLSLENSHMELVKEADNNKVAKFTYFLDSDNPYFYKEVLFVDVSTGHPIKLEVRNKNESLSMECIFENFSYNDRLSDDIFKIQSND